MVRLTAIVIVTCLLAGCSRSGSVFELTAHHGQSRGQVMAKRGEPQRDAKFPMSEAFGEFRIGLQNTYPLRNPANANVEIEEVTWQDGDYRITLWFHQVNGQWVVLDSCRWHKDVVF